MLNRLICSWLCVGLIFPNAFAGEPLPRGTVLEKDVYAFDQNEATKLMDRVQELEHKEELLDLYMEMNLMDEDLISAYKLNLQTKDAVISEYDNLMKIQDKRIDQLEKQRKRQNVEKYVFLFIGVSLTAGALITYDQLKR